ncbi:MAG TPA: hypothetical protein VLL52_05105 [Anaerolineae bacterium]|nr:hypothetical protein [Anaerolineae bacterium]
MAIASQIYVNDANGQSQFYVKQKILKLKEAVKVYADSQQTELIYQIEADRIIDFSAKYTITDQSGASIGSIKRQGARSLWRAHYDILDTNDQVIYTISEENAWIKVMDGLMREIPIVGLLGGYFFNPTYLVKGHTDNTVMRVAKQPSFLESSFKITEESPLDESQEVHIVLSVLMMLLLERNRG